MESETLHSLYVGSYGRGTAIDDSDIDILMELPEVEYNRFDAVWGNGQSRLLQAVRSAILESYPRSDVRADGRGDPWRHWRDDAGCADLGDFKRTAAARAGALAGIYRLGFGCTPRLRGGMLTFNKS